MTVAEATAAYVAAIRAEHEAKLAIEAEQALIQAASERQEKLLDVRSAAMARRMAAERDIHAAVLAELGVTPPPAPVFDGPYADAGGDVAAPASEVEGVG